MSRNGICNVNAVAYVERIVAMERGRGLKITHAIEVAADALGLSRRWVFSLYYEQPTAPRAEDATTLQSRFAAWLAADIQKSERIIAERRAMLAEMGGLDAAGALVSGERAARGAGVSAAVEAAG